MLPPMSGRFCTAAFGVLWLACTPARDDTRRGADPSASAGVAVAEPSDERPAGSQDAGAPAIVPESSPAAEAQAATSPSAAVPATATAAAPGGATRVYSKGRNVWIRSAPRESASWIGALSIGGSVRLKSAEPARSGGRDCPAFYAVEPRGYVCVDGERATLDAGDPMLKTLLAHAPLVDEPLPYRYGESLGLKRLFQVEGIDAPSWPEGIHDLRHVDVRPRSSVAWTKEVEAGGQTWLWTADLTFAPKSKVKPYEPTSFRGVLLTGDVRLPIAFFRRKPRPKYRLTEDGQLAKMDDVWERLDRVGLTGKSKRVGTSTYLETREDGRWVLERDAVVVKPRKGRTPWGRPIRLAGEAREARTDGPRNTWLEIAALEGWMIAYEDDRPVFATLISAGRNGAEKPVSTEPFVPPSTTPLGQYHINNKWVTKTLITPHVNEDDFIEAEVPWSQHFFSKYLVHAAYWHNSWGDGQSGGCVNLSPIDAKWLFHWTEPALPEGWHAVQVTRKDPSTRVIIHR
ncbi:L,D-transpeptidase [Sorangium sp. So ce131]|uniref:L,D-transpeptidase n=1 Tax=Sorangium sp. So ce131 TaxID=3133282 RepID=UPI003F601AA1